MTAVLTILYLLLLLLGSQAGSTRQLLQSANKKVSSPSVATLLDSTLTFWLKYGVDPQGGGFHGTLDRQGNPVAPTSKTIVQQARHLWMFSTLLASPQATRFHAKDVRAAADSAYNFIVKNMRKNIAGGGSLFVYEVDRPGTTKINGAPGLYGNAFAIYGLSAYARATGSTEARKAALNAFLTLDKLYHSPYGGYDETSIGFTLDSIKLPETAAASSPGCTGSGKAASITTEAGPRAASNNGKALLSQSFNSILHVTEALAELSRATGGSNPLVTKRLLELVGLQTNEMVVRPSNAGGTTPKAFISVNYDPRTWCPVGPPFVNYGHNIEAAWLLADAVDELQARGGINAGRAAEMKKVLQEIGSAAAAAGYDNVNGGLFDGSTLGAATPTSNNKVWWSQVESLQAFDWLQKQPGSADYKTKFQQTLAFITNNLWDQQYGELYWQVGRGGGPPLPFEAADRPFPGTNKGNAWKTSYHTGRAFLRLLQAGYA